MRTSTISRNICALISIFCVAVLSYNVAIHNTVGALVAEAICLFFLCVTIYSCFDVGKKYWDE